MNAALYKSFSFIKDYCRKHSFHKNIKQQNYINNNNINNKRLSWNLLFCANIIVFAFIQYDLFSFTHWANFIPWI